MTARAVCFRCDWQGEESGRACPRCGAALIRPSDTGAPRGAPPPESDGGPRRPEFLSTTVASEDAASRPPRRSGRFAAFAVLAGLVTAVLWSFLRAHEVPVGSEPGPQAAPNGSLVYSVEGPGWTGLWTWDPRTGQVSEGPRLDAEVVQLVSAQGALAGWLGVTTRTDDGRLEGSILRSRSPEARPDHVLGGDLIAWGPNGATLVSATLGSSTFGCDDHLVVVRERIAVDEAERALSLRTRECMEVATLGQTLASTYFTWERGGGTGVFFLGNGRPHAMLPGWVLLSASPTSDLLVRPAGDGGVALFWRGAAEPDPYRGAGGGPVVVREVLAWTAGADGALVVADVEDRRGLYLLDTTPGGDRVPTYVGVARAAVDATAAFDGSLYVAMEGRLLVYREGRLTGVDLPHDAPAPTGPIAWMPG